MKEQYWIDDRVFYDEWSDDLSSQAQQEQDAEMQENEDDSRSTD